MCRAHAVCEGGFQKAAVILPCFWRPWEVKISYVLDTAWMICDKHLLSSGFVAQSKKVLGCYFSSDPMDTDLDCLLWALSRLGVCRESQLQSANRPTIFPFCFHMCPFGVWHHKDKIIRNSCSSWSWYITRMACTHWKRQALRQRCNVFWIQINVNFSTKTIPFPGPCYRSLSGWNTMPDGRHAPQLCGGLDMFQRNLICSTLIVPRPKNVVKNPTTMICWPVLGLRYLDRFWNP